MTSFSPELLKLLKDAKTRYPTPEEIERQEKFNREYEQSCKTAYVHGVHVVARTGDDIPRFDVEVEESGSMYQLSDHCLYTLAELLETIADNPHAARSIASYLRSVARSN